MESIIDICQKYSNYQINDYVQKLDFIDIDVATVRKEIFQLISKNNYGLNIVSLRLPKGNSNYTDSHEKLELDAERHFWHSDSPTRVNFNHNKEYLDWHPDLENSYVSSLPELFTKLTGFNIGRVRLAWLMPNAGYPMHCDLEPTRFHIPLVTNPYSYIIHDEKLYNMTYGNVYHLITAKDHTAWNFGHLPRLHLVFSTYLDEKFENSIKELSDNDTIKSKTTNYNQQHQIDGYTLFSLSKFAKEKYPEIAEYCKELASKL